MGISLIIECPEIPFASYEAVYKSVKLDWRDGSAVKLLLALTEDLGVVPSAHFLAYSTSSSGSRTDTIF